MTPTIPARRMQLTDVAPRQYGAMYRFSSSVDLDHGLRALIERARLADQRLRVLHRHALEGRACRR